MLDACTPQHPMAGDVGLYHHTEGEWVSGESRLYVQALARGAVSLMCAGSFSG